MNGPRVLPMATTSVRHLTLVEGVHLHWSEAGAGRPTVLLHGVCDSHRTWRKVAPMLSPSRRLLMLDLPGHGLSDRPDAPYTVEWYAGIVGAWLDALGLDAFDLVGHSFGGGVAQMLLLSHGDRVRRLALVASGGLGREVNFGLRLWSMMEVKEQLAQPFLAPSTRLAIGALLPGADPEDVDYLAWMNAMPGTARSLSKTVRAVVDWRGQKLQFFDKARELTHELPPLELFWGDRDTVVPADHGTEMLTRLQHVKLTRFEGCGHFPHQERPEPFSQALAQFLDAPSLDRARLLGAVIRPRPRVFFLRRWWRRLAAWVRDVLRRAVSPTPARSSVRALTPSSSAGSSVSPPALPPAKTGP